MMMPVTSLKVAMAGCDMVFHLAANADVRFGLEHPERDLQQNTIATFNVLEAMRANGIMRIGFSSTGSVYGEAKQIPTREAKYARRMANRRADRARLLWEMWTPIGSPPRFPLRARATQGLSHE